MERGAGNKSVFNGSCSRSNAGRERKSQFPDTCAFILRLHTNSFRGEESSLALETLCLLGEPASMGVEEAESHLAKLWRTSLEVQWLGLRASTAGGMGSIPGRGTRIPRATRCAPPPRKKEKLWKLLIIWASAQKRQSTWYRGFPN